VAQSPDFQETLGVRGGGGGGRGGGGGGGGGARFVRRPAQAEIKVHSFMVTNFLSADRKWSGCGPGSRRIRTSRQKLCVMRALPIQGWLAPTPRSPATPYFPDGPVRGLVNLASTKTEVCIPRWTVGATRRYLRCDVQIDAGMGLRKQRDAWRQPINSRRYGGLPRSRARVRRQILWTCPAAFLARAKTSSASLRKSRPVWVRLILMPRPGPRAKTT